MYPWLRPALYQGASYVFGILLIPILTRCHADLLFEQAREVLGVLETELVGHLIEGQLLVQHVLL